ncbi:unnamed protein product [Gadus morhua 'NCC']
MPVAGPRQRAPLIKWGWDVAKVSGEHRVYDIHKDYSEGRHSLHQQITPAPSTMTGSMALVLLVLLPLVRGQVPHWGPCPEPITQADFSIKQFAGRWYEIAKLPAQFEKGRCIETNFTVKADNSVRVVSSEILRGELRKIEGFGITEDPKNPAKLGITFSYVLPYTPYWILSTDYVNTAVVYSCTDILRLFHVEFAWVLSRVRAPPAGTLEKADEVFAKNSIDVTQMINTRQQGC